MEASVDVKGVTKAVANQGVLTFDAFELLANPGDSVQIEFLTDSFDVYQGLNSTSSNFYVSVNVQQCNYGEVLTNDYE